MRSPHGQQRAITRQLARAGGHCTAPSAERLGKLIGCATRERAATVCAGKGTCARRRHTEREGLRPQGNACNKIRRHGVACSHTIWRRQLRHRHGRELNRPRHREPLACPSRRGAGAPSYRLESAPGGAIAPTNSCGHRATRAHRVGVGAPARNAPVVVRRVGTRRMRGRRGDERAGSSRPSPRRRHCRGWPHITPSDG